MIGEGTVRRRKKMRQPSVLACNRAPQASLSVLGRRAARLMRLLPIIEAAPHGSLQGGSLTSSSFSSKEDGC